MAALGGAERYLDIIGVNYYHNNQWIHGGAPIDVDHPLHKPLHKILVETYSRYGRPMLIAETGCEGDHRSEWLEYVAEEARAAMRAGVPPRGHMPIPDNQSFGFGRRSRVRERLAIDGSYVVGPGNAPSPCTSDRG